MTSYANQYNRLRHIHAKLVEGGVTDVNARAILANIGHETGGSYDPKTKQRGVGKPRYWFRKTKSGRGTGLIQWDDRRFALKDFAEKRGKTWDDMDSQIAFIMFELNGPEKRAYELLKKAVSLEDKVKIFSEAYERPGIPHMEERIKRLEEVERELYKVNQCIKIRTINEDIINYAIIN